MMTDTSTGRVMEILSEARALAKEYRDITGRPLGITGEIAEYEAVRLLGLELAPVRQAGYDALRQTDEGNERLQIKGRCVVDTSRPGQRIGSIQLQKEWDSVLLVLLDGELDAVEIYEADRKALTEALLAPGSRARNERGALSVSKFKRIGRKLWSRPLRVANTPLALPAAPSDQSTPTSTMSQNNVTGAAGNHYGHANAARIAVALGVTLIRRGSNQVEWEGKKAVIKSARRNTTSVGVTYSMLEDLDVVLAAFEQRVGGYHVYALPAGRFLELAVDSRSAGNGDRVGIVTRTKFTTEGRRVATVSAT